MKRVLAVSRNEFLLRKIELSLMGRADVVTASAFFDGGFDVCLWDADTMGESPLGVSAVTVGRRGCELTVPFEFSTLLELVDSLGTGPVLSCHGRFAYLRSEKIRLTELEAALLSRLISAKGEFVSRAEILRDVWGDSADEGIINVYVHYLREKLERGEKIIISSRAQGYKIDGRYI